MQKTKTIPGHLEKRIDPRETPPVPKIQDCVPPGLIGYEEFREERRLEAKRDRETETPEEVDARKKAELITRLKAAFRFIDVEFIAESVEPWDLAEFKSRVAEEQTRYLRNKDQ